MTPDEKSKIAVLCYVDGPWAYFTTQPLEKQWGDDWNDAPYEHNAGQPYYPYAPSDLNPDGSPKWEIIKLAYEGPFDEPKNGHANSQYSVEQINAGDVPWLRISSWSSAGGKNIKAGVTIAEFADLVSKAGGTVYLPAK